jgi:spermidine/putrescine transport system permease protein
VIGGFKPLTVYAVVFALFLYGPVLLLPLFSFNDSNYAIFPLKGFTFDAYRQMAARPATDCRASGRFWP